MEDPRETFTRAVRESGRSMFRAARSILDCDADAEDAVGEAVLRAWQSYGTLRKTDAARAWLVKIAVNCAYDQRRRSAKITYLDDLEPVAGAAEDPEPSDLWDAVLRLPEDHRVVVTLFYYEDMTVEQIAQTLDVAQGTVKSRLSRARKNLKELLREEGPL